MVPNKKQYKWPSALLVLKLYFFTNRLTPKLLNLKIQH